MKQRQKVSLLDANVLLRYLLDDDPVQSRLALSLMKRLEGGGEAAELEDVILAETIWVLEKRAKVPRFEIARTLSEIVGWRGIRTRAKRATLDALSRFSATNCDIADCILAARARSRRTRVWSFDEDFRKLGVPWERPY